MCGHYPLTKKLEISSLWTVIDNIKYRYLSRRQNFPFNESNSNCITVTVTSSFNMTIACSFNVNKISRRLMKSSSITAVTVKENIFQIKLINSFG